MTTKFTLKAEVYKKVLYRKEMRMLRKKINSLMKRAKRKENILLVGEAGAGKSSLKNTITQVLTGTWEPEAQVGQQLGAASPITDRVKWYNNCSVETGSNLLPNLIDMAGYCSQDLDNWKLILTAIVDGRLPDNSNLTELLARLETDPRFLDVFNVDVSRKITKIIFVASVGSDICRELVELVMDVAQPTDGTNRLIHVYGALTNCDRVGRAGRRNVTQSEFETRKTALIWYLRIENAEDDYFSEITNYSTLTKPGNIAVETAILDFLKKLLVNKVDPHSQNPLQLSASQRIKLCLLQSSSNGTLIYIIIAVAIACAAFLLIKL